MKRALQRLLLTVCALSVPGLMGPAVMGQGASVPEIPFDAVEPLKMPTDLYLGEVAGVALNSKRHVFVYNRTGGAEASSILDGRAAQLFEFGPDGVFIKEIGKNLYSKGWAHSVRVDREDNIWLVDNGSDEIVKLGPDYKFKLVLGRRNEAVGERMRRPPIAPGTPIPPPRPGYFFEPTDVAFDAQGNIFVSDGYQNSSVHKFDKDGHNVKMVGTAKLGGPGQFNTPHGIAVDAQGTVYVADRNNNRIQVLDNDLNWKRDIKYDPPFPANYVPPIPDFGKVGNKWNTLWPNTLCITPGPGTQYIYTQDMFPGNVEKFTLDGKLVGKFSTAGRKIGQIGWVHALACVSENEVWAGELLNWRVQKFTLHPERMKSTAASR
jgi:hypothetical protein